MESEYVVRSTSFIKPAFKAGVFTISHVLLLNPHQRDGIGFHYYPICITRGKSDKTHGLFILLILIILG
jgi:hypothetical protein